MIVSKTPFRVSFLGGGSDIPWFYEENDGAVICCAIQRYMYVSMHRLFGEKSFRLKYSKTEDVNNVSEIEHPIIKACLEQIATPTGVEIASIADVPAGTGLGSSSSFTVGLLNALYYYKGITIPKWQLGEKACEIEIDKICSPIGKQDQYAAALGGMNVLRFRQNGRVDVEPVQLKNNHIADIENRLRLYYLGGVRDANDLLREQANLIGRERKIALTKSMVGMVGSFKEVLETGDVARMGGILDEGWQKKKEIVNGISTQFIDEAYNFAMENGAEGGKLLGAGGNGFLLLCHENHEKLSQALNLPTLPVNIDMNGTICKQI